MNFMNSLFLASLALSGNALISMEQPITAEQRKESSLQNIMVPLAHILVKSTSLAEDQNNEIKKQAKALKKLRKLASVQGCFESNESLTPELEQELIKYRCNIAKLEKSYEKIIANHQASLKIIRHELKRKTKHNKKCNKERQDSPLIQTPYTIPKTRYITAEPV